MNETKRLIAGLSPREALKAMRVMRRTVVAEQIFDATQLAKLDRTIASLELGLVLHGETAADLAAGIDKDNGLLMAPGNDLVH